MTATNRRAARARPGLVAMLSLSLGCSFATVQPPPRMSQPSGELRCTSDPVPPFVDLALLTFAALGTLNTWNASDEAYEDSALSRPNRLILSGTVTAAAL